jgi:hypothetical protein
MSENREGIERLKEAVPRVVNEAFEKDRRVVLLSYVGQRLRREGINFKEILGDVGLAKFIREQLADQIELTSSPEDTKIVSAYPSTVDLSREVDPRPKLGTRPPLSTDRQAGSNRLFIRDVWYAFSHPLEDGKVRYVLLTPSPTYRDVPTDEPVHDGLKVPSEAIVPTGTLPPYERNRTIISNIESWAAENAISLDEISEQPRQRANRTALDVLLNAVSASELSRISMPLDIVKALRLKRID